MAFTPGIPGERGYRRGVDAEANRIESQEARRLGIPQPKVNVLSPVGASPYMPAAVPWENGVLWEATLVVGLNTIAHGLGRTPKVWAVADVAPQVYVEAYHDAVGGAQTVATGTDTTVKLDSETVDWGGNFNAATYTFTAPHAGLYFCSGVVTIKALDDGARLNSWLQFSTLGTRFAAVAASGAAVNMRHPVQDIVNLAASETCVMRVNHNASGGLNIREGVDDTRLVIRSDQSLDQGTHDSTNIYIYSARTRTVQLWLW